MNDVGFARSLEKVLDDAGFLVRRAPDCVTGFGLLSRHSPNIVVTSQLVTKDEKERAVDNLLAWKRLNSESLTKAIVLLDHEKDRVEEMADRELDWLACVDISEDPCEVARGIRRKWLEVSLPSSLKSALNDAFDERCDRVQVACVETVKDDPRYNESNDLETRRLGGESSEKRQKPGAKARTDSPEDASGYRRPSPPPPGHDTVEIDPRRTPTGSPSSSPGSRASETRPKQETG